MELRRDSAGGIMADPLKLQPSDELLRPLAEVDEAGVENIISNLIENLARPVIAGILKQKFSGWRNVDCVEDLQSEVVLRLLSRLRQFRQNPQAYSIWNFRDYVVATTGRVYVNYLRARFPNRSRLQNSLMYLLTRDSAFFLADDEKGLSICGLSKDTNRLNEFRGLEQISVDPAKIRSKVKSGHLDSASLRIALKELFTLSRTPIEFNDVMKIIVAIFSVQDKTDYELNTIERVSAQRGDPEKAAETSQFLKKMWDQITQLPLKQRTALLLNLKDLEGRDLLSVFPLSGIATFREIAKILELSLDQFAAIWKEIPIGDLKIAELLGVTRQQVINLRKSGRERLMRRMGD
jgi:hypothetical protein